MARINDSFAVDPILKEEFVMNSRITVAVDKDAKVTAIQKGGAGPLPYNGVIDAIEIAVKKAKGLLNKLPKK
jgi:exosome complex RNA-binding protein Rrp42 (RNase PH superfamily)